MNNLIPGVAVSPLRQRLIDEIRPFWRHPVRFDNARLVTLIGEEPHTPLDVAIERTLVSIGCLQSAASPSAFAA